MDWNVELLGNTIGDWLTALGLALTINVVVGLLKWAIIARLARVAKQTSIALDDAFIAVARRTRQWLIFGVTLFIGTRYLELPERVEAVLTGVATVAAFLQLGFWGMAGLEFWLERYRQRTLQTDAGAATSLAALSFIGRVLLWAIVLLLALDNLGVDVTALVAGLGVGGIAVALAVQNILGDLFASLSIVIDKPFVIGDFIIVDNYMGTVEHVGLKTTRIRSLGGEQIVFSNADLLKARVRNYKRMYERRVVFTFGVLYQTTPEQAEKIPRIVEEIVRAQPLARFDRAHFFKFGDSSLDYEVVYWMKDPEYAKYMDTQQAINLALMRALAKEGIGFAYPTRSLYVEAPVRVEVAPAPSAS
ncbi:mechanosensitive ion channel family protein [Sinimarinibacterium thermocellulolyticum]|uniref:Mechanosensitive ion channel family protein n=1 Tax=Sinimarinibacterium thermocellulolyticum TaxID=3170016 RepID=A0ABV2ADB1_9GAMM